MKATRQQIETVAAFLAKKAAPHIVAALIKDVANRIFRSSPNLFIDLRKIDKMFC